MQPCVAYRTHNTQQTERRNSSVDECTADECPADECTADECPTDESPTDECPADEMVEGEHGVGKDDSDAYDYDYVETFTQS